MIQAFEDLKREAQQISQEEAIARLHAAFWPLAPLFHEWCRECGHIVSHLMNGAPLVGTCPVCGAGMLALLVEEQ